MALHHDTDTTLARAVRKAGSQVEFAKRIGKRQSVVHDWLVARRPLPAEYIRLVAREFDMTIDELVPEIDDQGAAA